MFLTKQELHDLTGYALSAWQRRWLDKHGYIYEVSATGAVKVLRSFVERKMNSAAPVETGVRLNFDAIKKRA